MLTYLAIFLSISVLIIVFVRRWFVLSRKQEQPAEKKDNEAEGKPLKKKRFSSDEREEVEKLFKRGVAMIKAGKDDEAIKCFVQALTVDELHIETQHRLALLYLQKQMYAASAALFKKLGELTHDPLHYSHLGLALYQQSEYEAARDAYQKAVDLDPSRPQRFVSLSQVYRALGQLNNSIVALNKAVEMDNENLEFLFLAADLQAELNNKDEAKKILSQILLLDPKNKEAKALLKSLDSPS